MTQNGQAAWSLSSTLCAGKSFFLLLTSVEGETIQTDNFLWPSPVASQGNKTYQIGKQFTLNYSGVNISSIATTTTPAGTIANTNPSSTTPKPTSATTKPANTSAASTFLFTSMAFVFVALFTVVRSLSELF